MCSFVTIKYLEEEIHISYPTTEEYEADKIQLKIIIKDY